MNPEKEVRLSAVGVISNSQKQILLTQRNVHPFYKQWVMPGGNLKEGESPQEGVLREVEEEVGLKGQAGKLLAKKELTRTVGDKLRHYTIYFFEVMLEGEQEVKISPVEVADYAWVNAHDYQKYDIPARNKEVLDEIFAES